MKHFTTEQCIDFVNGKLATGKKRQMEEHLNDGCKRCAKTLSLWQRVRETAKSEANYQPPEAAVRIAKAAFAGSKWEQKKQGRNLAEVLFDSFLQPLFADARSAGSGTRQMLYRAEPYHIDLHLEMKQGGKIMVTGQLLDARNPDAPAHDVPVMLSNLRGHVVQTVTSEHGEFREEIKYSGDLEMMFTAAEGKPVVISLRDALGRLSGGGQ